jgi:hypothetical protein
MQSQPLACSSPRGWSPTPTGCTVGLSPAWLVPSPCEADPWALCCVTKVPVDFSHRSVGWCWPAFLPVLFLLSATLILKQSAESSRTGFGSDLRLLFWLEPVRCTRYRFSVVIWSWFVDPVRFPICSHFLLLVRISLRPPTPGLVWLHPSLPSSLAKTDTLHLKVNLVPPPKNFTTALSTSHSYPTWEKTRSKLLPGTFFLQSSPHLARRSLGTNIALARSSCLLCVTAKASSPCSAGFVSFWLVLLPASAPDPVASASLLKLFFLHCSTSGSSCRPSSPLLALHLRSNNTTAGDAASLLTRLLQLCVWLLIYYLCRPVYRPPGLPAIEISEYWAVSASGRWVADQLCPLLKGLSRETPTSAFTPHIQQSPPPKDDRQLKKRTLYLHHVKALRKS